MCSGAFCLVSLAIHFIDGLQIYSLFCLGQFGTPHGSYKRCKGDWRTVLGLMAEGIPVRVFGRSHVGKLRVMKTIHRDNLCSRGGDGSRSLVLDSNGTWFMALS
ncbi:hypothetical protein RIF29_27087 [Crotalaria pallida]|uniref:Secreted protein n=1 Tax=Crotalaria pallida TaxID=3830 RepID=A0AAN9ENF8_CROPI